MWQAMTADYKESCRILRKCLRRADSYDKPLLQEALIECQTLQHLTANYYIKGYRPPPAYSMVQAHSKQHKYMGYVSYAAEEAIIDAVDCGRSAVEALNL